MTLLLTPSGVDTRTLRWDEAAPLGLEEQKPSPTPAGRMWLARLGKHNFLSVIASVDGGSLHVSIAHNAFDESTEVVMVLARKGEYVNIHQNCFHLWESACGREGR